MTVSRTFAAAIVLALAAPAHAQHSGETGGDVPSGRDYPPPPDYEVPDWSQVEGMLADEADVQAFRDKKLGITFHWGPVALTGAPMSWGRHGPRPGAGRAARDGVRAEKYDTLYRRFDPQQFDADEWMDLVAGAGAEWFYFTTKHHDGFAMWDTSTSDYDIMESPFARDIVGELAEAAHERDLGIWWYYSQPDWTHPNALQEGHYEHYLPYMKAQMRELLTRYGEVDGIFFDHLASKHYHWDTENLIPEIRQLQPGILINNRIGNQLPQRLQGDVQIYELRVGPWEEQRAWLSNITLGKAWAWHGGDLVKPGDTVVRLLLQVVGNGGSLGLNLGPTPQGEIFEEDAEVLRHLGRFMENHGDALQGTRRGNYQPGVWGASAARGNDLFLYVLQQTDGAMLDIALPPLAEAPLSAELLSGGAMEWIANDNGLALRLAGRDHSEPAVVRLTYATPLSGMPAVATYREADALPLSDIVASSARDEKRTAAVLQSQSADGVFGEGIHIKDWWEPAGDDEAPSLTLELAEAGPVSEMLIAESIRTYAVRDFRVSWRDGDGRWHEAFRGSTIGEQLGIALGVARTDAIRIEFLEAVDAQPNITSIRLFGPNG